jgi:hypothetical protein
MGNKIKACNNMVHMLYGNKPHDRLNCIELIAEKQVIMTEME